MAILMILYSVMFISELAHGQGAYGRVLIPTDENTKTIVHGVHNWQYKSSIIFNNHWIRPYGGVI